MSNLKESCNLEIKNRNLKSFELCNLQRFIVFFIKKIAGQTKGGNQTSLLFLGRNQKLNNYPTKGTYQK